MKPIDPPLPPAPLRPDAAKRSLDERIALAEQALLARQQRLLRGINQASRRARAAAQPRRLLVPVLGAALAAAALWLVWSSHHRSLGRAAAGAGATPAAYGKPSTPGQWASLFALAWPLLPSRWRASLSPAKAGTLFALGLPAVQRLLVGAARPPLATAPHVDLDRFAGTWYQVARLPATAFESVCDGQPTMRYARRPDGLIELLDRCPGRGQAQSRGVARALPGSGGSRLQVSHWPAWLRWLPLAWDDHWVLDLDAAYDSALIGSPDRRFLCVLSRRPQLPAQRLRAMVDIAQDHGFAVERLHFSA